MTTEFVSDKCPYCGSLKITLDEHYKLPKCFDFILVCPKHPGKVYFDLSISTLQEIGNAG